MKKTKFKPKNFMRIFAIILMFMALIFGITISIISSGENIKQGAQYRGGFQATVGVFDANVKSDDSTAGMPNGDSEKGAEALLKKLSPFSDGSVDIKKSGKYNLTVSVPTDMYSGNTQMFKSAVESIGGLFVLNDKTKQDIMFDKDLMTKISIADPATDGKIALSEILGNATTTSEPVSGSDSSSNKPYLSFELANDKWKTLTAEDTAEGTTSNSQSLTRDTQPSFDLISNIDGLISNWRSYFSLGSSDNKDEYYQHYIDGVIKTLVAKTSASGTSTTDRNILNDVFEGTYYFKEASGNWKSRTGSIVDSEFLKTINSIGNGLMNLQGSYSDLEKFMNPDGLEEHKFTFTNEINKYMYDSNSVAADFKKDDNDPSKDGRYAANLVGSSTSANDLGRIDSVFASLTNIVLNESLQYLNNEVTSHNFNKSDFKYNFIYSGTSSTSTSAPTGAYIHTDSKSGKQAFLLPTENYTFARTIEAQISANTQGLSFHVYSITTTSASVSNIMFIASIIFLAILAIAAMSCMIFFYRLLGLFTIIVALALGALTILMYSVFNITIGPEFVSIMFVILGLAIDISVVYFEALKNNIYIEKRSIQSSFKISNRETLGTVIDMIAVALIPNIVLFWIGTGALKNFATISTLGLIWAFILFILFIRIFIYFLVRTNIFKKASWLLPMNTSFKYKGSFLVQARIGSKQLQLASYDEKEKLTSKELIKIKNIKDEIDLLTKKQLVIEDKKSRLHKVHADKTKLRIEKQLDSIKKRQEKPGKKNKWKLFLSNRLKSHENYLSSMLEISNDIEVIENNKLKRKEHVVNKVGIITAITSALLLIISVVIVTLFGFNYSASFGKGTNLYIYGTYIEETYNNVGSSGSIFVDKDNPENDNLVQKLYDMKLASINEVKESLGLSPNEDVTGESLNKLEVKVVSDTYNYIITNNYLRLFFGKADNIKFPSLSILSGIGYSGINNQINSAGWISINTTSNLIKQSNILKIALQKLAGDMEATEIKPSPHDADRGVLAWDTKPHTANNQMIQIVITFAIVLLALIVYMIIRFKWTYYIALALGIIIAMILTVSMIAIFRVPVSIEILSAIVAVISFALITGISILGRGKSMIISRDEKTLHKYFDKEIDLSTTIRKNNKILKNKTLILKNDRKILLSKLNEKDPTYKMEADKINKEFKLAKLNLYHKFKITKLELKEQMKFESNKNNFLKHIFASVLKFGLIRLFTVGIVYILIGAIAAITMPTIAGMGITLIIGVVASMIVMLTVMLPIWIILEQKRIRAKYGYKKYVNNINVSAEEQIIDNIND